MTQIPHNTKQMKRISFINRWWFGSFGMFQGYVGMVLDVKSCWICVFLWGSPAGAIEGEQPEPGYKKNKRFPFFFSTKQRDLQQKIASIPIPKPTPRCGHVWIVYLLTRVKHGYIQGEMAWQMIRTWSIWVLIYHRNQPFMQVIYTRTGSFTATDDAVGFTEKGSPFVAQAFHKKCVSIGSTMAA